MQSTNHTQTQSTHGLVDNAGFRAAVGLMARISITLLTLVGLFACGDAYLTGSNQPPYDASIAGTYVATTFIVTRLNQAPVDALAECDCDGEAGNHGAPS